MLKIQWGPENSGVRRRLLDSNYDFRQSNEHEKQQLCSVNSPILRLTDKIGKSKTISF